MFLDDRHEVAFGWQVMELLDRMIELTGHTCALKVAPNKGFLLK